MRFLVVIVICLGSTLLYSQEESSLLGKGDFINLTIFNKGFKPRCGYVEGPKKNGSTFSYGLNVGPFTKIKKYWSVGTKFYVKQSGLYVLAYEVKAEDRDQLVDISRQKKK